jgi:hypothetical protein
VAADSDTVSVFVRVVGPAYEPTFGDTGEYEPIWSGEVTVPAETTITASSGKQYRLFVEDGRYKATRLSDSTTWDLGDGDDVLGATSVLAALHQASLLGGFDYVLSDAWFPGAGLYITAIDGFSAHGAVGWAYRVWNDAVAPAPGLPVDRFLLGYDSSEPAPPHDEVVFYWGYGEQCLPLRVAGPEFAVQCGDTVQLSAEYFVDDGYTGDGTWLPADGATVCVNGECSTVDDAGIVELIASGIGEFTATATMAAGEDYYYIPSDERTTVVMEGPCKIISFTVVDNGDPGIDFGAAMFGSMDVPELAQSAESGAVTLSIGPETNVPCSLLIRAESSLAGSGDASMGTGAIEWDTVATGTGATPLTETFAEVGTAPAETSTSVDVWLWLNIPADQPYGVYSGELLFSAVEQTS